MPHRQHIMFQSDFSIHIPGCLSLAICMVKAGDVSRLRKKHATRLSSYSYEDDPICHRCLRNP